MLSYVPNHSKQLKPTKVIKLQWIESIWCQKHQTTQNYKSDQITMKCMDLTSKRTKMLSYVANHSKQRKSTKVIKVQWIASIWCQNEQKWWVTSQTIQNNANLQRLSKYNELHRFDVKTIKYVELRPKPFQTQQNYKSDQITMNWIDLTSKRSKMLSYVPNHSKHSKTTKVIKLRWSAWIWRQNEQKCWVSRKPFKTTQMYKGYQSTMNCIDLTLKRSKMFSYVPNHSKQLKPTKVIKLQWIESIWCQKHQTTQNYKSDQITMKCMD